MKTITTNILLGLSILFLLNCKQTPKIDYKYADKEAPINCPNSALSANLVKEMLYSFEGDILNFNPRQSTLAAGYSQISSYMMSKRELPKDKISEHTLHLLKLLKQQKNLWVVDTAGKYELNYNHPIVSCIGENIKNKDLKTTFNALLTTNSMNNKLIAAPIRSKIRTAISDKALATFIALNTFYPRLLNMDFSENKIKEEKK